MKNIDKRIEVLSRLGNYFNANADNWKEVKHLAQIGNPWFCDRDIEFAVKSIADNFLQKEKLVEWISHYQLPKNPKEIGIVMAGNIPLVGFHDFLCVLMSGHRMKIKASSKDEILIKHIVLLLTEWEPVLGSQIEFAERLNGCDAYIATGSNNTARYFEQYFSKYPHIIRKNRTSVAVLDGSETDDELIAFSKDVFLFYGLGCRNVTQVYVPENYSFSALSDVFKNTEMERFYFHKYKNNFDYYLTIYLLNKVPYTTNDMLLLVENDSPFSPVAVLHYKHYKDKEMLIGQLSYDEQIQCIIGKGLIPFGQAQQPKLNDYADGVDTMAFLCEF